MGTYPILRISMLKHFVGRWVESAVLEIVHQNKHNTHECVYVCVSVYICQMKRYKAKQKKNKKF